MLTSETDGRSAAALTEQPATTLPTAIVIEAGKQESLYWQDIWRYRELLYFLSWRDILVRYKQTVIGIAWSILRPLLMMLALTFAFNKIGHLTSPGVPYAVFVMAGLLPWQFFSTALSESSMSLVANANMISKIYFPRILIPVSAVVVSFVDAMIGFLIFVCLMAFYHYVPTWRLVTLPLFMLLTFIPSIGLGLWFAALNVKYRDFRYIVPFIVQFGVYVSPVGYTAATVKNPWIKDFFYANPIAGIIDGWRWALVGEPLQVPSFISAVVVSFILLAFGIWYFRRTERIFADLI